MSTSDKLQQRDGSKTSTLTARRRLQVPDEGGRGKALDVQEHVACLLGTFGALVYDVQKVVV